MKRVLFKLIFSLGLALGLAGSVLAHGVIERAEPPVGGAVSAAPIQVKVWFTEPVEPRFSALEVYPADSAERVDEADLQLETDGALAVSLRPNLPPGVYRVVWRVFTPGDGHQTGGAYAFGVGVAAQPLATLTTERTLLGDVVRFLLLSGQVLFVGVAVFRWAIPLPAEARFRRALGWVARLVRLALVLGFTGMLYVQAQTMGASALEALGQGGLAWLLRAAMTVLVIVGADAWLRGPETKKGLACLAGGLLLLTTSLTSHSAAKFGLAGAAVDWLHLLGASVWLGGLVCAAIAFAHGERSFLPRFSIVAAAAVGILAVSGVWLGSAQVGSWAGLLLTEYGRALLMKLAVAVAAIGLGAVNSFRLKTGAVLRSTPERSGGVKTAPAWTALEAGLGLLVIAGAAALTNLPPAYSQPTDGAPTRIEQSKSSREVSATVTLWPARLGVNTVEVRLADRAGKPMPHADVRTQFVPAAVSPTSGAVITELELPEVGGGLYSATGTTLTDAGEWQLLLIINEQSFLNFDYSLGPDAAVRPGGAPLGNAVEVVGWLNRYAVAIGAGLLLLSAAGWSWLAWRSLQAVANPRTALALWLAPGLLLAGAVWLWVKLSF